MTSYTAQKQAAAEKIEEMIGKVERAIQGIGPALQSALDNPLIPDDLKASAMRAVQSVIKQAQTGLAEAKKGQLAVAALASYPAELKAAGWREVAAKASKLAEAISTQDAVSELWNGPAKDKYTKAKEGQAKAVSRIESQAEICAGIMDSADEAELAYVIEVLGAVVAWAISLVLAAGATGTIVGAPAGVVYAVTATVAFVSALAYAEVTFARTLKTLAGQLTTETGRQTDFGTGNWPEATKPGFRQATPDEENIEDWEPSKR
jgi:hypothetical protein